MFLTTWCERGHITLFPKTEAKYGGNPPKKMRSRFVHNQPNHSGLPYEKSCVMNIKLRSYPDILSQLQFFHLGTKVLTRALKKLVQPLKIHHPSLKTLALDHITGQTTIAHQYCRFFCDILCQYPSKPPKCLVSDLSSGQDQYFQFPIKHLRRGSNLLI